MTVEQVDLAVVGAGPAGLAAAIEVSRLGGQVVVLDEGPIPGGRLPSQIHQEPEGLLSSRLRWSNGKEKAERLREEAIKAKVKILCSASVWTVSPRWFVGTSPTAYVLFKCIDMAVGLRVSEEEMEGLDAIEHGGNAYRDFTTINHGSMGLGISGPGLKKHELVSPLVVNKQVNQT